MNTRKRGRPVGSTKENNKKMFSFRLSAEEAKAVKELLAKMRKKLVLFFVLMILCAPAFSYTIESKPVLDLRNRYGYGYAAYMHKDEIEYEHSKYKYDEENIGAKKFYSRNAQIISHPLVDIQANGKIYRDPGVRVKVPESRRNYTSLIGWSQEDYGTIVEYDIRRVVDIVRLYVYALDNQERVTKYKITETKHKNPLKHFWFGLYDVYTPVSYFVQTKVGEKPKNYGKLLFDKKGRMLPPEKQTKFSEIVEYDMDGNILSIYRKNEWDRINEYEPDGKTLRTYHDTKYIPYLQWQEEDGKRIYKTIDMFQAKLFDTKDIDLKTLLDW